jgi:hypothetical protein
MGNKTEGERPVDYSLKRPVDPGQLYWDSYRHLLEKSEGAVEVKSGGESVPSADVPQVAASGAE